MIFPGERGVKGDQSFLIHKGSALLRFYFRRTITAACLVCFCGSLASERVIDREHQAE